MGSVGTKAFGIFICVGGFGLFLSARIFRGAFIETML
jgi:hypothetical protein